MPYKTVYIPPPEGVLAKIVDSPARGQVVVTGRRVGKTEQSLRWSLKKAWDCPNNEWENWLIFPTRKLAKAVAWRKLKRIAAPLMKTPLKQYISESELRITLFNGNTIALKGSAQIDDLVGSSVYSAFFDEFGAQSREGYEVVRPALADTQGYLLFAGTPRGANHFKDLYDSVLNNEIEDWVTYPIMQTKDSKWVTQQEIELARSQMSPRMFKQEFEGSFENWAGTVYDDFTYEGNVSKEPLKYDPSLKKYIAIDIGYNEPTAVLWVQYDSTSQTYFILREFVSSGITPENLGTIIKNEQLETPRHKIPPNSFPFSVNEAYIYAGRDIEYRTIQGSGFSVREQLQLAGVPKWAFHQNASRNEFKGIQNVRNHILNAAGERRLIIDPSCKTLIRDLRSFHYPEKDGEIVGERPCESVSNHRYSHTLDALRYCVDGVSPMVSKFKWEGVTV